MITTLIVWIATKCSHNCQQSLHLKIVFKFSVIFVVYWNVLKRRPIYIHCNFEPVIVIKLEVIYSIENYREEYQLNHNIIMDPKSNIKPADKCRLCLASGYFHINIFDTNTTQNICDVIQEIFHCEVCYSLMYLSYNSLFRKLISHNMNAFAHRSTSSIPFQTIFVLNVG